MNKKVAMAVLGMTMCAGPAFGDGLDLTVNCPTTVKVGYAINVTVKPYNYTTANITLSRYMAGIVANTSGTVGGAGVYGPFAKVLSLSKVVPPRSTYNYTPGTLAAFSLPVVTAAPSAAGKMAMVFVSFMDSYGHEMGGDSCMVSIIP